MFVEYLKERGKAASTVETATYRLRGLMKPAAGLLVRDLTPARCASLYKAYAATRKPDTHQGALDVAKACGTWWVKHKLVASNPWADVEPTGKKTHGKPHPGITEARKLAIWCLSQPAHKDGPCAVLVALLLGLRASEVIRIHTDHVDDEGRVLWVKKAKTRAGVRPLRVPEVLRPCLLQRAKGGILFPYKRDWVRDNVKRACRKAGVPVACAQALRGTFATLSLEAGVAPEAVARSIGHVSVKTTKQSYAATGAGDSAVVDRVAEKIGLKISATDTEEKSEPEK